MYKFVEINSSEIDKFNESDRKGHIFQTSYWAELKKDWKKKFIAGYDNDNNMVITATILLRKAPYINKYMGYIPRSFTCDYNNKKLLIEFTEYLREFAKKNNISFITIDPDIHLKENEEALSEGTEIKNFLKSLGYKNTDSKNFEAIQPNFVFRLPLPTEGNKMDIKKAVFKKFSSKTRYNIKVAEERGLSVEVYDKETLNEDVLDRFHEIMVTTGKRDNFLVRHREYFKDMIDYLYPHCRLYMVKYSYENDFNRLSEKLNKQEEAKTKAINKIEELKVKLEAETDEDKKSRIEKKLNDQDKRLKEAERQIEGFKKKISDIEPFKGQEIYLSGSIYLYYGNKAWYLYGASENILRDTMPNFAMQWSMICDSIDLGCDVYDFRGVSGDLNPENPLYGLYKFKKGFNGNFVEFIGEFDIVVDNGIYTLYKKAFPQFKKIRNAIMNKKQ
ncbi:TPA: peptidoglycan bridge formation glycyltransferase FemA/FemB family protein [Clostridium perfringens]|uniref:Peptidoglycan bridge formation glycyltransferase FemA/FemB family protein n=1 Tax=Clostridium perfringens TaxID=1502 RepID=A0A140GSR1_CLOPF|nr:MULTISPECIES: peptidoglycan bridge formation glycyltransferase FemA/FemB family protein [Clostridium]AMN36588.1 peptidoglycan bridge formation protein FemAB [Clostridium perfringens]AQW24636.1 peptidoglycan bridge formation protein FemAB [Clostridium perfringens]EGT0691507.1 peptidoglycan bridge formation glycyltransferase FemA/FemB family protein [Clostridium perfringens]EGT3606015.1 peptidoglycan bridge formation glycyltransferase FemA/FemB family protein [Clostridium perfringens]EHK23365